MPSKLALPSIPSALADVALIDGPTCAAACAISLSAWYELVRTCAAPAPVMRAARCTRWRIRDLRAWLIERAAAGIDPAAADSVIAKAKKASIKAREPAAVAKAQATRRARAEARKAAKA